MQFLLCNHRGEYYSTGSSGLAALFIPTGLSKRMNVNKFSLETFSKASNSRVFFALGKLPKSSVGIGPKSVVAFMKKLDFLRQQQQQQQQGDGLLRLPRQHLEVVAAAAAGWLAWPNQPGGRVATCGRSNGRSCQPALYFSLCALPRLSISIYQSTFAMPFLTNLGGFFPL